MRRIIGWALVGATCFGPRLALADSPKAPVAPARARVSFPSITADPALGSEVAGIEALLTARLEHDGRVRIQREAETKALLTEDAKKLLAGCTADCGDQARVLLHALDTPYLLVARLSLVGTTRLLEATLLSTKRGEVVSRASIQGKNAVALAGNVDDLARSLLGGAHLLQPEAVIEGLAPPRFAISLQMGNGLTRLASDLFNGTFGGLKLNIEGDFYPTPVVVLFLQIGTTLGSGTSSASNELVSLDVSPVGFGAKRLWIFGRWRVWAGAALGPGLVGLFSGKTQNLATAFATTLVAGGDYRFASHYSVGLEASTSLTDAILGFGKGNAAVPFVFGVSGCVSYLFL